MEVTFRSEDTDLFNHKISELGFEAAMDSLVKKHRLDVDRFVDQNNYFSQPKEIVRDIFHAIKDPDTSKKMLQSLGMSESTYDFSQMKKLFKKKNFGKPGVMTAQTRSRKSLQP